MKKSILLLLAVVLIFSCAAIALADVLPPTLTLQVSVSTLPVDPNVTYTATLKNYAGSTSVPVITFYCNNVVVGTAPVNNLGIATLRLGQKPGTYHAISAWLNTTNPILSNSVTYIVP